MPGSCERRPASLEKQCLITYLRYLHEEVHLLSQLRKYNKDRSVLMRMCNLDPDRLQNYLQTQLSSQLKGIQHDLVRQQMVNLVIANFHTVANDFAGLGKQHSTNSARYSPSPVLNEPSSPERDLEQDGIRRAFDSANEEQEDTKLILRCSQSSTNVRSLPLLQLLELLLHHDLKELDFGKNKLWTDHERWPEVARVLWKIVGERCRSLEKFVVPKELSYSSTLGAVIGCSGGANLTCLTLKRNVPNNMFLAKIGTSCPNLEELDIAGAEVVTDFGVVCLLFSDPEQIFIESWNREKTVGPARRNQRAFPHPHFDKPIPDPTDPNYGSNQNFNQALFAPIAAPAAAAVAPMQNSSRTTTSSQQQFLHLKRSFHEVISSPSRGGDVWERLPVCNSLRKVRLENTKVKGDGASVVLEVCPNVHSLGYLVFVAAGHKSLYERNIKTKFTEIFYRGPSDQKLVSVGHCCPSLRTIFLGSNSQRHLNASVFSKWKDLRYLTLENIFVNDISAVLALVGHQLIGFKVQCSLFDVGDVGLFCPNLENLVVQKERPSEKMNVARGRRSVTFPKLKQFEANCYGFPLDVLNHILSNAPELRSVKVLQVEEMSKTDVAKWVKRLPHLETLILFQAASITKEMIDLMLDNLPKLKVMGDFGSFDVRRPQDTKRILSRAREENWNLSLIETDTMDERNFIRKLSLHWFYLTEEKVIVK